MLPCGSDVLLRNVVFAYSEILSNATCKTLLNLTISILSLQHYDVFDVEGWAVGEVVAAMGFTVQTSRRDNHKGYGQVMPIAIAYNRIWNSTLYLQRTQAEVSST